MRSSVNGSTVTLAWDAVPSASAGYVVEALTSTGISRSVDSDSPTLTATGVDKEVYTAHVRARNACGAGYPSNDIVVTVR